MRGTLQVTVLCISALNKELKTSSIRDTEADQTCQSNKVQI